MGTKAKTLESTLEKFITVEYTVKPQIQLSESEFVTFVTKSLDFLSSEGIVWTTYTDSKTWEILKFKRTETSLGVHLGEGYWVNFKMNGTSFISGRNTQSINLLRLVDELKEDWTVVRLLKKNLSEDWIINQQLAMVLSNIKSLQKRLIEA